MKRRKETETVTVRNTVRKRYRERQPGEKRDTGKYTDTFIKRVKERNRERR